MLLPLNFISITEGIRMADSAGRHRTGLVLRLAFRRGVAGVANGTRSMGNQQRSSEVRHDTPAARQELHNLIDGAYTCSPGHQATEMMVQAMITGVTT